MKTYNVALIGCGQMGAVHLEHIYYKENVAIKCVCDIELEKAEAFKRKYHAERIETDAKKCITAEDIDIVIIATYPSTHLELLKLCIANKKHVICEKPITSNRADGREFARIVKENPDCKVLVGHILRHNITYNKAKELINNGVIGSPIIMRMAQNHHTMNWQRYLQLIDETSPIIDCGVHYIDVMRWFTGAEIVNVSGIGARTESDVPKDKYNYGLITVRLSDGSVGYYEAGWSNTMSSDNMKEFVGPKGSIKIIYRKDRQTHQEEGDLIELYKYPEKQYEIINIDAERKPTDMQFDHLVRMIEENAPAIPSIDDVLKSFEITLDADEIIKGYCLEE
jgi:predicted dehydrogenase